MDLLKVNQLDLYEFYQNKCIKVKIFHVCPFDGQETNGKITSNSQRILICTDIDEENQINDETNQLYLIVILKGELSKNPLKKTCLNRGQIIRISDFKTHISPKNKIFKCNTKKIDSFYPHIVMVSSEYNSSVNLVSSVKEIPSYDISNERENDDQISTSKPESAKKHQTSIAKQDENLNELTISTKQTRRKLFEKENKGEKKEEEKKIDENNKANKSPKRTSSASTVSSPQFKKLKFTEDIFAERQNVEIGSPRKVRVATNEVTSSASNQKYEYKTLYEVHKMMPVSHKCYVNVYGIVSRYDTDTNYDKKLFIIDETTSLFPVKLLSGKSNRTYPMFLPGDIVRIHRLMLTTDRMDKCCQDPKDILLFKGFQTEDSFEPISCAETFTINDFDKKRKQELEEWHSDELLSNTLDKLKDIESDYVDIVGQIINKANAYDKVYVKLWDTTKPCFKSYFRGELEMTSDNNTELVQLIDHNEMSIQTVLYGRHSLTAMQFKSWDLIVIFNAIIKWNGTSSAELRLSEAMKWGKEVRMICNESILGRKLLKRIQDWKMSSIMSSDDFKSIEMDFPEFESDADTQRLIHSLGNLEMETQLNNHQHNKINQNNKIEQGINNLIANETLNENQHQNFVDKPPQIEQIKTKESTQLQQEEIDVQEGMDTNEDDSNEMPTLVMQVTQQSISQIQESQRSNKDAQIDNIAMETESVSDKKKNQQEEDNLNNSSIQVDLDETLKANESVCEKHYKEKQSEVEEEEYESEVEEEDEFEDDNEITILSSDDEFYEAEEVLSVSIDSNTSYRTANNPPTLSPTLSLPKLSDLDNLMSEESDIEEEEEEYEEEGEYEEEEGEYEEGEGEYEEGEGEEGECEDEEGEYEEEEDDDIESVSSMPDITGSMFTSIETPTSSKTVTDYSLSKTPILDKTLVATSNQSPIQTMETTPICSPIQARPVQVETAVQVETPVEIRFQTPKRLQTPSTSTPFRTPKRRYEVDLNLSGTSSSGIIGSIGNYSPIQSEYCSEKEYFSESSSTGDVFGDKLLNELIEENEINLKKKSN